MPRAIRSAAELPANVRLAWGRKSVCRRFNPALVHSGETPLRRDTMSKGFEGAVEVHGVFEPSCEGDEEQTLWINLAQVAFATCVDRGGLLLAMTTGQKIHIENEAEV